MDIGVIRERGAFDRRVALTPPVVRRLAGAGHTVWVETGAGDGAMFRDSEYIRSGGQIVYSPNEVIQRAELVAKIGRPSADELALCRPGMALMAFYHLAVADRWLLEALAEQSLTAIGCEVIQQDTGRLPCLRRSARLPDRWRFRSPHTCCGQAPEDAASCSAERPAYLQRGS
jgi:alanine dehydrogenase